MRWWTEVTQTLGGLTLLALALGGTLFAMLVLRAGRALVVGEAAGATRGVLGYAFLVASIATAGSLYLSEIAGLVPCIMCWYQRAAMYPLVPILGLAAWRGWPRAWMLALPLSVVGLGLSAYHTVIQRIPALDVVSCSVEAPCTAILVRAWGFVSIPVMAGSAFLLISALMATVALAGRVQRRADEVEDPSITHPSGAGSAG